MGTSDCVIHVCTFKNGTANMKEQEYIPVGCVPPASVATSPASMPPTMHAPCHTPPPCTPRLPCMPPATHGPPLWMPPATQPPPPVNRITDRCKNITFPQLRLRAVKTQAQTLLAKKPYLHVSLDSKRLKEEFLQSGRRRLRHCVRSVAECATRPDRLGRENRYIVST